MNALVWGAIMWFSGPVDSEPGGVPWVAEAPGDARPPIAEPLGEVGADGFGVTGDWNGWRQRAADRGVRFEGEYAVETLGVVSGGRRQGWVAGGLLGLAIDADFERLAGWRGGGARVSALYPHGASASRKYAGDLGTISNIDAPDAVRLFEVWIEQELFDGKLSLRAGQLGADEEFAFTDSGSGLLNATFGWPAFLGANVEAPSYPVALPGARLRYEPGERAYVQLGVFDGAAEAADRHGVRVDVGGRDGVLVMGEVGATGHWLRERGWALKLGGWAHTGDFEHLYWGADGLPLPDPASSGEPRMLEDNWGGYVVIEQQLWRAAEGEDRGVWAFFRGAAAPEDRNLIESYFEGGAAWKGWLPGRTEDVLAFGVAHLRISDAVKALSRRSGAAPAGDETVLEATWLIQMNSWWTIQPDVQWILNPGGDRGRDGAVVIGCRTSIVF